MIPNDNAVISNDNDVLSKDNDVIPLKLLNIICYAGYADFLHLIFSKNSKWLRFYLHYQHVIRMYQHLYHPEIIVRTQPPWIVCFTWYFECFM